MNLKKAQVNLEILKENKNKMKKTQFNFSFKLPKSLCTKALVLYYLNDVLYNCIMFLFIV